MNQGLSLTTPCFPIAIGRSGGFIEPMRFRLGNGIAGGIAMKRIQPVIWLLLAGIGIGYANQEITVELPGGATMEMVWIEPETFTMGTTASTGGTIARSFMHPTNQTHFPVDFFRILGRVQAAYGFLERSEVNAAGATRGSLKRNPQKKFPHGYQ
jgi:hypothetical protein